MEAQGLGTPELEHFLKSILEHPRKLANQVEAFLDLPHLEALRWDCSETRGEQEIIDKEKGRGSLTHF